MTTLTLIIGAWLAVTLGVITASLFSRCSLPHEFNGQGTSY